MNIEGRLTALERVQVETGPLLVYGEPTSEQHEGIEEPRRIGRLVICWPVPLPR